MNFLFKYLGSVPKLISFISLIFLLGALWYEGLHYNFFGIDIFSYISLTDAIMLFLHKLFLMVCLSLLSFIFFYSFQVVFQEPLKRFFLIPKYNRSARRKQFFKGVVVYFFIGLVPMMLFMVYIPMWFRSAINSEWFILLRAFIVLLNIYFMFNWSQTFSKSDESDKYRIEKYSIITLIVSFFIIIYYYHRVEILRISDLRHSPRLEVTHRINLKENNEVIDCIDSAYFLGKTKDYIFILYPSINYNSSKTRIISMDEVEEINTYKTIPWYSVFP